jgi:hypothetical protein
MRGLGPRPPAARSASAARRRWREFHRAMAAAFAAESYVPRQLECVLRNRRALRSPAGTGDARVEVEPAELSLLSDGRVEQPIRVAADALDHPTCATAAVATQPRTSGVPANSGDSLASGSNASSNRARPDGTPRTWLGRAPCPRYSRSRRGEGRRVEGGDHAGRFQQRHLRLLYDRRG